MLLRKRLIAAGTAEHLLSGDHSGFSVHIGAPIAPWETESRRRLARYLLKSQMSLERLSYDEATCLISYGSHKRGRERTMSALDFLSEMSAHIADRGQHQVLCYGYHAKRSRGRRTREAEKADEPT